MRGLVRFAATHLGVDLWPGQVGVLRRWETSGKRRAVLRLGRRSGKGVMAATAAIFNAVAMDYSGYLRPGEERFILAIGTREQQAREFVRVVRELLEHAPDPDLAALVDKPACTLEEVVFRTGVTLRAMPCSSRSTRGLPVSLAIFDEAAHMQSETDGFAAFQSVWRAVVPSTAQFGELGYVLTTSTPLWPTGWFRTLCDAGDRGDPDLAHIHRPTWEVNPNISRESLNTEFLADPDGAAREYGAEFVSGLGAFLDAADVTACMRVGQGVLPPVDGIRYVGSIDPAFSRDNFALGIGHNEDDRVVVDGVWVWNRAGYERTLDEVTETARRYGVRTLRTDQFSSQAVVEGLQRRRMDCEAVPWDNAGKWQAFSRMKALINTRGIELPDDDPLRAELVRLEARPTPSGATRVAAAGSGHDDRATVVAALVDMIGGHAADITVFDLDTGSVRGRSFHWEGDEMVWDDEVGPLVEVVGPRNEQWELH